LRIEGEKPWSVEESEMEEERFEITIGDERLIGIHQMGLKHDDVCIVASHGLAASKDSPKYIELARRCKELGIPLVRFDYRGLGESDGGFLESVTTKRMDDLDAVINYVEDVLGIDRVGVFGSSLGGFLSILRASADVRVGSAVILATPFNLVELVESRIETGGFESPEMEDIAPMFLKDLMDLGLDMDVTLRRVNCPTLVIHGSSDEVVPVEDAQMIHMWLRGKKQVSIIEGGDHVFSVPHHLDKVMTLSMDWFSKHLI